MNDNETITGQCFVNGMIGLHEGVRTVWTLDTTDANGGEWIARFVAIDGIGDADALAQALRAAVVHEERHDNPAEMRPVVLLSIYNSERDEFFVAFGDHRIPGSLVQWS